MKVEKELVGMKLRTCAVLSGGLPADSCTEWTPVFSKDTMEKREVRGRWKKAGNSFVLKRSDVSLLVTQTW